jgi:hypothetical protein
MGKTTRTRETIYLDPEKYELLVALAAETRIPRAVLEREAIDLVLEKYGKLKPTKRRKP